MKTKSVKAAIEQLKPRIPVHVSALLEKAAVEAVDALPETVLPREITDIKFDKYNRLVISFSNGDRLVSNEVISEENIQQYISVSAPKVFDYIAFDTTVDKPLYQEGLVFYDKHEHSLAYYNDDSTVTVNISREQIVRVYNNTGFDIPEGKLVYINGAIPEWPTIALARADTVSSQSTIGMTTTLIENNSFGYVTTGGEVHNIYVNSFPVGATLYLSATSAGDFTTTQPLQPNFVVEIGMVTNSDAGYGDVLVKIDKKPWFPFIELLHIAASTNLPLTPAIFKPQTLVRADGINYSTITGEIEVTRNGVYGISLQINAEPSASNKNIYFYVEDWNIETLQWEIKQYSARLLRLPNAQETQLTIVANRYYPAGHKHRLYLWGDDTVALKTTDIPGTTPGTVTLPAFRFTMA